MLSFNGENEMYQMFVRVDFSWFVWNGYSRLEEIPSFLKCHGPKKKVSSRNAKVFARATNLIFRLAPTPRKEACKLCFGK